VSRADGYTVVFTAAARRGMNPLPAAAAGALFEHLPGLMAWAEFRVDLDCV
jgi:hypothetical protein